MRGYQTGKRGTKIFMVIIFIMVCFALSGCNDQEKANQEHEEDLKTGENMPSHGETETDAWKNEANDQEKSFPVIIVEDDGRELPVNQEYDGLVCNIKDSSSERRSVVQLDGSIREEEITVWYINNICFSIPDDGVRSRAFGIPIFTTEAYAEGEMDAEKAWHKVAGKDCPEFNEGMEETRRLILDGFLQKPLEKFLLRYPELQPEEREYVLWLTGGGRTDRDDGTSWWDLYYMLTTKAENGEVVSVASIDITRVFRAQGEDCSQDAECRIWSVEKGYWRLLEDPASDLGRNWVSQLPDEDFSSEEKIFAYVEEKGAGFDCLLPKGADQNVEWSCRKEQGYWYDYLIWSGSTDTYELTLAIPVMEEGEGSWYLASRIRKEASNKEKCQHTLSLMMQTFRASSYIHIVKDGENLWSIYSHYIKGCEGQYSFSDFIRYNKIKNPDLIYPGWSIRFPWIRK